MNKRQRKKQLKKFATSLETVVSGFMLDMLSRQSFVSSIIRRPLKPPFRMWQELGVGALVHYIGTRDDVIWTRVCDDEIADMTFLLNHDAPITCLQCARS